VKHAWLVAIAGAVGFAGNEAVARYRMRVGRQIGSAALVADGLHARTDALTSLSVIVAAAGAAVGWRWADPVVGLAITVMILRVLADAAREVFARILDGVDPQLVGDLERSLSGTPGVCGVGRLRVRWVGHSLQADCEITADDGLTLVQAHRLAHDAEHRLLHAVPRLAGAIVHVHPAGPVAAAHHATTAHH